jgi:hypothetical protein
MTFVDADNRELASVLDAVHIPRVGENVRLAKTPYVVERVGYDIPDGSVQRIWVVCRSA